MYLSLHRIFKFMPDSLLEAAVIDGATMGTTFRKIVVPMAKNTTMTVLTYNFVLYGMNLPMPIRLSHLLI